MKRVKSLPLCFVAKEEIRNFIIEQKMDAGDFLPSENEFCQLLGISRGTLREAMRLLEEEGSVLRKQGVGTIISHHASPIQSTLDINEGNTEMIQGKGMQPGTLDARFEELPANKLVAKELRLKPGDSVMVLTRIRTADDTPVAYTIDYLPTSIVTVEMANTFQDQSLYQYLEDELGFQLTNSLLRLVPKKANKQIANVLEIKVGTPLMLLLQTDTDINQSPVVYSEEYFVGHRFEFVIMRRRRRHSA